MLGPRFFKISCPGVCDPGFFSRKATRPRGCWVGSVAPLLLYGTISECSNMCVQHIITSFNFCQRSSLTLPTKNNTSNYDYRKRHQTMTSSTFVYTRSHNNIDRYLVFFLASSSSSSSLLFIITNKLSIGPFTIIGYTPMTILFNSISMWSIILVGTTVLSAISIDV